MISPPLHPQILLTSQKYLPVWILQQATGLILQMQSQHSAGLQAQPVSLTGIQLQHVLGWTAAGVVVTATGFARAGILADADQPQIGEAISLPYSVNSRSLHYAARCAAPVEMTNPLAIPKSL
jgi:cation diffusion facilitator CzcD-associated flavoprotein CzcO